VVLNVSANFNIKLQGLSLLQGATKPMLRVRTKFCAMMQDTRLIKIAPVVSVQDVGAFSPE
jgi:hypothetical protein